MSSTQPSRAQFTVVLDPQVVNRLNSLLKKTAADRPFTGLLFGRLGQELTLVSVFRSLTETGETLPAELLRYPLTDSLLAVSRQDPELSGLAVIGWYSLRPGGGLNSADIEYQNKYFPLPNQIALILKPEQHGFVLELYARSAAGILSAEEYRWASARLSPDVQVLGPMSLPMRAKVYDQLYDRAYEVTRSLDREEQRAYWRERFRDTIEEAKEKLFSLRRVVPKLPRLKPAAPPTVAAPEPQVAPKAFAAAATQQALPSPATLDSYVSTLPRTQPKPLPDSERIGAGDPPLLPAVIPSDQPGIPWVSSLIIFVIVAALTFAFAYFRHQPPAFLSALAPDTSLALRVEGQGDRVLLTWSRRNPAVRSARGGILHIRDGARQRDVHLDTEQVQGGAVLYRPGSDDVTFRLEVQSTDGTVVSDSTRVLDGTH